MYDMYQCGDTYKEFDRWALCAIKESVRPTTEAEFIASVKHLIKEHNNG